MAIQIHFICIIVLLTACTRSSFIDTLDVEFKTLENVMNPDIMSMLSARLTQIPTDALGSLSFFIPFEFDDNDNLCPGRSLIEYIILHVLAPAVLGDVKAAYDKGYLGVEWWVQERDVASPKEYHLDTAITWCRDNGWPPELLNACYFYPTIGTVFYLSDVGGATGTLLRIIIIHAVRKIFTQTFSHCQWFSISQWWRMV